MNFHLCDVSCRVWAFRKCCYANIDWKVPTWTGILCLLLLWPRLLNDWIIVDEVRNIEKFASLGVGLLKHHNPRLFFSLEMSTRGRKLELGSPWSVISVQWAPRIPSWGNDLALRKCKSFHLANDSWKIINLTLEWIFSSEPFCMFQYESVLNQFLFSFSTVSFFFKKTFI